MNDNLIRKFRKEVNDGNLVFEHFVNVNGKNHWSCICSAMDWISMSVSSIDFDIDVPALGADDLATWKTLLLLMQVASVKEAIVQLHRVFYPNEKTAYLKDDRTVWKTNDFGSTDDEYFEMLRACFGAHSVNLKDPHNPNGQLRYFASWPASISSGFSVYLYPNDANMNANDWLIITLEIEKLQKYFELRYNHLNDMIKLIREMKRDRKT